MKKLLIALFVVILVAGAGAGAYYYKYGKPPEPVITELEITRGEILKKVGATGTIEAVTLVDVGTQVTGVIKDLYGTDFNSIVKKGQLIAKIDPATIQATIERDKASLESAYASLDSRRISLEDSKNKLRRAEDLYKRKLVTDVDLENAQVTVKTNEAAIVSQLASIKQSQAALNQDQVNLGYTDIYAPITGIVINRKVDIGQTVVSNNAATSMFQIAADLAKMQVKASVDESDVGLLRPNQRVTFRVDAYPTKEFVGSVSQVRLQPVVSQNVVTYTTIINVPNPFLELKPGMTATVNIEIQRAQDVLRIPAGAIRFRATRETFEGLNIPVPPEMNRGTGRGQRAGQNAAAGSQPGQPAGQPAAQPGQSGRAAGALERGGGERVTTTPGTPAAGRKAQGERQSTTSGSGQPGQGGERGVAGRGGQGGQGQGGERGVGGEGGRGGGQQMTPEERQKRTAERLAQMTPEQRAQYEERMKQFGQGGGRGQGGQGTPGGGRGQLAQNDQRGGFGMGGGRNRPAANESGPTEGIADRGETTVDALFAPLSFNENPGRVWVYSVDPTTKARSLKSIAIRTRLDDGTFYELVSGEVTEGMKVVTNIDLGLAGSATRPNAINPFGQPGRGGMGMPGGGGGGGGGRGR